MFFYLQHISQMFYDRRLFSQPSKYLTGWQGHRWCHPPVLRKQARFRVNCLVEQSPRVDASFKINDGLKHYLNPKICWACSFICMALVWKPVSDTLFLAVGILFIVILTLELTTTFISHSWLYFPYLKLYHSRVTFSCNCHFISQNVTLDIAIVILLVVTVVIAIL